MTEHDLSTLVRAHVAHDEPPFRMSADTAMALGRRTLHRRRARRGLAGLVVAAAAVVAVPLLPWDASTGSGDRTGIDPATAAALENYDAQKMPQLLDEHVRVVLTRSVDDPGPVEFSAGDSQGNELPVQHYDKASDMTVRYGGESDHRLRVSLMHARSEAEGDARRICADDLESGYAFSCTVTTSRSGDPVTTKVMAMRPLREFGPGGWGALTADELRIGVPAAGNSSDHPIDPDDVWFQRTVEVVHSETFLPAAAEVVRAPDFETAERLFEVPVAAFEDIVTDPALVIPEPPIGPNGCPWTLPDSNVTCGTKRE